MPDHHVKGQPAASTYVREKGCVTFDTNRDTPCTMQSEGNNTKVMFHIFIATQPNREGNEEQKPHCSRITCCFCSCSMQAWSLTSISDEKWPDVRT